MPFTFSPMKIPDVVLVEPKVFQDGRGLLKETFKRSDFEAHGLPTAFMQDVLTRSSYGVLRGMHYQKAPQAQGKLVSAISGRVFDVAADIREGSPTFGEWVAIELSSENHRMLYIPPGSCHSYCVLSDEAELLYKMTNEYSPELEAGIIWNDADLGIQWPVSDPTISPKDELLPTLSSIASKSASESPAL